MGGLFSASCLRTSLTLTTELLKLANDPISTPEKTLSYLAENYSRFKPSDRQIIKQLMRERLILPGEAVVRVAARADQV